MTCQVVGEPLPYDSLAEIRRRMTEVSPNLTRYGDVEEANFFAQAAELAKVRLNGRDAHCALSGSPIQCFLMGS